jgi:uncharacterized protein YjgD (DUF1641 family)
MAQPIPFHTPPVSASSDVQRLRARLDSAPEAHAAALLEAYDLLQELHDRGILDLCRSALDASEELLGTVVRTVNTPEAVRVLRNLLFGFAVLGRIDPERLQGIVKTIPEGMTAAASQRDEPVGLWRLLRRALSRDSLRGLSAGIALLESFGRHLQSFEEPPTKRGV